MEEYGKEDMKKNYGEGGEYHKEVWGNKKKVWKMSKNMGKKIGKRIGKIILRKDAKMGKKI